MSGFAVILGGEPGLRDRVARQVLPGVTRRGDGPPSRWDARDATFLLTALDDPGSTRERHDAPLRIDEPSALYLRRDVFRLRFLLSELTSLPSWTARRKRLRDLAFPSPAYMRKEFGVSNRFTLTLFYLVRAARGVFRLFRRIA